VTKKSEAARAALTGEPMQEAADLATAEIVDAKETAAGIGPRVWRVKHGKSPLMEIEATDKEAAVAEYCRILRLKAPTAEIAVKPTGNDLLEPEGEPAWYLMQFRDSPEAYVKATSAGKAWDLFRRRHGILRTNRAPQVTRMDPDFQPTSDERHYYVDADGKDNPVDPAWPMHATKFDVTKAGDDPREAAARELKTAIRNAIDAGVSLSDEDIAQPAAA
jgi:hypothetical protein